MFLKLCLMQCTNKDIQKCVINVEIMKTRKVLLTTLATFNFYSTQI